MFRCPRNYSPIPDSLKPTLTPNSQTKRYLKPTLKPNSLKPFKEVQVDVYVPELHSRWQRAALEPQGNVLVAEAYLENRQGGRDNLSRTRGRHFQGRHPKFCLVCDCYAGDFVECCDFRSLLCAPHTGHHYVTRGDFSNFHDSSFSLVSVFPMSQVCCLRSFRSSPHRRVTSQMLLRRFPSRSVSSRNPKAQLA